MQISVYYGTDRGVIVEYSDQSDNKVVMTEELEAKVFAHMMNKIYSTRENPSHHVVFFTNTDETEALFSAARKKEGLPTINLLAETPLEINDPKAAYVVNVDKMQYIDLHATRRKNSSAMLFLLSKRNHCLVPFARDINAAFGGSWNNCSILRTAIKPDDNLFTKLML